MNEPIFETWEITFPIAGLPERTKAYGIIYRNPQLGINTGVTPFSLSRNETGLIVGFYNKVRNQAGLRFDLEINGLSQKLFLDLDMVPELPTILEKIGAISQGQIVPPLTQPIKLDFTMLSAAVYTTFPSEAKVYRLYAFVLIKRSF